MMKALVTLLLLEWLDLAWCCSPAPGAINIARSGKATQSSTFIAQVNCSASNAIDGQRDPVWSHGSCCHTNDDLGSWWRLDLKQKQKVNVILVFGRSEVLERMQGLEVRFGDSLDNNNPLCAQLSGTSPPNLTFCCNGREGRYISAVIPGRREFMHLCEVEVYGDPPENVCW